MLAETTALLHAMNHAQITAALEELCTIGICHVEKHARFTADVHVGPFRAQLRSNEAEAGTFFAHCLPPWKGSANAAIDLNMRILVGSAPPGAKPPPWNFPHTHHRHLERLHLADTSALCAFYDADRRFWMILDGARRNGLFWIANWHDAPFWEQAAPLKMLFNWYLAETSNMLLHGAVLGNGHEAWLLAGAGGSGKSTTVATCVANGFASCGDDLVLVSPQDRGYAAYGLYDALKLESLPGLINPKAFANAPKLPCGPKLLMRLSDISTGVFAQHMKLKAIMTCEIGHRRMAGIERTSPAAALRALAPSTCFLLRGREQAALQKMGALVRALPCYRLVLAPHPAENARALRQFMATAAT